MPSARGISKLAQPAYQLAFQLKDELYNWLSSCTVCFLTVLSEPYRGLIEQSKLKYFIDKLF